MSAIRHFSSTARESMPDTPAQSDSRKWRGTSADRAPVRFVDFTAYLSRGHLSAFARPDAAKPMAANILFGGLGSWLRPHILPASGSYPRALSPLGLSSPAPSDFPVPQCGSQDVILAGPAYCNGVPPSPPCRDSDSKGPFEFPLTRRAIWVG